MSGLLVTVPIRMGSVGMLPVDFGAVNAVDERNFARPRVLTIITIVVHGELFSDLGVLFPVDQGWDHGWAPSMLP